MFGNLFKSKTPAYTIHNIIWKTALAKQAALLHKSMGDETLMLFYFNEDTKKNIQNIFTEHQIEFSNELLSNNKIILHHAKDVASAIAHLKDRRIIFVEHDLSFKKEKEVLDTLHQRLGFASFQFYNSLDDILFAELNAGGIKAILDKLGLEDSESISHNMIDNSIIKYQQKYDAK